MLNKHMKRLMRVRNTAYTETAIVDPRHETLSTWCKESWAAITPEVIKIWINVCFKIYRFTLALDDSEDHAWCAHNTGEGCRELIQEQRVEWEAAHPDVTFPPLQLPVASEGNAIDTNPITALKKEPEGKLLPPNRGGKTDSDVKLIEADSNVELRYGLGVGTRT